MEQDKTQNSVEANESQKEGNSSLMDKAGNLIEKLGHKISDAGAPGLGQKVHDLGDKLETDHANKTHPHEV